MDHPAVAVSVIKRAEDDQGWVIRLSETTGQPCHAVLNAAFAARTVPVVLKPFELKTLYLPDDAGMPVRESLLTEL